MSDHDLLLLEQRLEAVEETLKLLTIQLRSLVTPLNIKDLDFVVGEIRGRLLKSPYGVLWVNGESQSHFCSDSEDEGESGSLYLYVVLDKWSVELSQDAAGRAVLDREHIRELTRDVLRGMGYGHWQVYFYHCTWKEALENRRAKHPNARWSVPVSVLPTHPVSPIDV